MLRKLFKKDKKSILVIEDNKELMATIDMALNANGYEVMKADNGKDGLTVAERERPDLVILDIGLPDIDGWWVLQNLKAVDATKKIPVVIFSQLSQTQDVNMGFNLGAEDYLLKPMDLPKLLSKLKELLNK